MHNLTSKINIPVKIYITDKCNLHCKDCHWFSEPVKESNIVTREDILYFIEKWQPKEFCFTGGEPTLWPYLAETINSIPLTVALGLNTNGTHPEILDLIERPVTILLSYHKKTNRNVFNKSYNIIKDKGLKVTLATFDSPVDGFKIEANQLNISDDDKRIGKYVKCRPRQIYFGSDGRAYFCERGLRAKSDNLTMGFSLRDGIPSLKTRVCKANKSCLTASGFFDKHSKGWAEQIMSFCDSRNYSSEFSSYSLTN